MVEYLDHLVPLRGPDLAPEPRRRSDDPDEPGPRGESLMVSTSWPDEKTLRRRWQREFFDWYRANECRFAIKLKLLKCDSDHLDIGFYEIDRVITATVVCNTMSYHSGDIVEHHHGFCEITVNVWWLGEHWDIIEEYNTYPEKVAGGYACGECRRFRPQDNHPIFDSPGDLRRAEVFEPFLAWVNCDLAKAVAVAVSGEPGRMTWAYLFPSDRFDRARRGTR